MSGASTHKSFLNSPFYSLKHTNYFQIYDELLLKFVGLPITFLEIGILDGGSLFMWRDFLGDNARIIGFKSTPIIRALSRSEERRVGKECCR